jgi:hypothetical protein
MRVNFVYRTIAAILPALILASATGCATPSADATPPQLKSEKPLRRDDLLEETKPEPPPDKPLDDLRIEPLRTA